MRISVLGATGPLGFQFVLEAIENEHEVIALVRNPDGLSSMTSDKLKVIKVDIFKEEDLVEHFKNTDVVVSCLGTAASLFGLSTITFYLDSIKPIVAAMRTANKKRLICMSSWGVVPQPDEPKLMKYILRPFYLSTVFQSMVDMEEYLKESCSDIDYTVVRPGGLSNNPSSGKNIKAVPDAYFTSGTSGRISRRDVAKFLLKCVITEDFKKQFVAIGIET